MRIDTKLNNIDNAGARTMKYIRYFGKEAAGDKVLIVQILIIIILAVLVVICWMLPDKS
jgi:t-SNARE complex subunit (syntaxin)